MSNGVSRRSIGTLVTLTLTLEVIAVLCWGWICLWLPQWPVDDGVASDMSRTDWYVEGAKRLSLYGGVGLGLSFAIFALHRLFVGRGVHFRLTWPACVGVLLVGVSALNCALFVWRKPWF